MISKKKIFLFVSFILVVLIYFNSRIYRVNWVSKYVVIDNYMFKVWHFYQVDKNKKPIKPDKNFVIFRYNDIPSKRGLFWHFIKKQYRSNNNVFLICFCGKDNTYDIAISDLCEKFHKIVSEFNISRYTLVYGNLDRSIVDIYLKNYISEVNFITHITGSFKLLK